ncbi:glycosyl hydrolase family 28-related protein [Pontiella sulfatireligans]|uniref:Iota-carrageenase n=1 Tax=Pontiella sulfatireligans TaxID=2750658 RepID=A0A6C2UD65_9BACT|nr:glycosyl hydrolase family 28-related protein [Pontiella sulfatireligans]VGO18090.1 Iota-carrageenase [Pontiella sulfatireligans]
MKNKRRAYLLFLGFVVTVLAEPAEQDFYKDTIQQVSRSVNLVKDYGASGSDDADDSAALQKAVDEMTVLPDGGKIMIPQGRFILDDIQIKSNVHIEVDPEAVLVPPGLGIMFSMGRDAAANNCSIRGAGGRRYTVDLTSIPAGRTMRMGFVNCKDVDNFMISDFNVLDNFTALSSLTFNLAERDGNYFRARNGVVKNGNVDKGHYGYGVVQAQAGYNILFKDLSATGGITLRLETGAKGVTFAPADMNLDQIFGRNISIANGHGGVMMGSHVRQNGHVDIDGVYAESAILAASAGVGFANAEQVAAGLKPGRFAPSSIIRNVHAVYGEKAQLKPKNFPEVPAPLQDRISKTLNPDGVSYDGPSVAAAATTDPKIRILNVTMEGFEHQPDRIITERKRPWRKGRN